MKTKDMTLIATMIGILYLLYFTASPSHWARPHHPTNFGCFDDRLFAHPQKCPLHNNPLFNHGPHRFSDFF